jgi:hypothetical protein
LIFETDFSGMKRKSSSFSPKKALTLGVYERDIAITPPAREPARGKCGDASQAQQDGIQNSQTPEKKTKEKKTNWVQQKTKPRIRLSLISTRPSATGKDSST